MSDQAAGAAGPGADHGPPAATPAGTAGPGPATGPAGHHDPAPGVVGAAPAGREAGQEADQEVAALRRELDEARDQRLRALADADNIRKRCAVQVSDAAARASAQVAAQWLPVVDNLDRALAHAGSDPDALTEGIGAVRDQALAILAALGYPRRHDAGKPFDPARHEAVATRLEPDVPAGTVVEVLRPGYGEPDHQLRPAQVVVARAD
ncbi:MAG TPA: nucleotide exchange factor GrpE [Streptosporangiaceae bacterium]